MPCPFPCNFYSLTHWLGKARVGHRWNWILDIVVACYKPTSLLLHWRGNHIFSLVTHNTINVRLLTWNKKFRKKLQLTSFLSIQQNSYKNAFWNQLTHTFVSWWNILSWPLWSWPQPPGSWDLFPLFNEFVIIFLLLTLNCWDDDDQWWAHVSVCRRWHTRLVSESESPHSPGSDTIPVFRSVIIQPGS